MIAYLHSTTTAHITRIPQIRRAVAVVPARAQSFHPLFFPADALSNKVCSWAASHVGMTRGDG
jgi:hypothetical protein